MSLFKLGKTHVPHRKNTADMPAVRMNPPASVEISMSQHIGAPATPTVKVGDKVGKDTVVAVLEAMKMENEIFAGQDGTIASVEVAQGASVTADQVLITMN